MWEVTLKEGLDWENLPIYNAEDGCGPRSRRFVEVTRHKALENARRKNVLWVLVWLHADAFEHEVQQWRKFLLNRKNKNAFTEFVVKGWRWDQYITKLTGKVTFRAKVTVTRLPHKLPEELKSSTPHRKKQIPRLFYMQLMQLNRAPRRWLWHQKIQTYSCFA